MVCVLANARGGMQNGEYGGQCPRRGADVSRRNTAVALRLSKGRNFKNTVPVHQGRQHHKYVKDLVALKLKSKKNAIHYKNKRTFLCISSSTCH